MNTFKSAVMKQLQKTKLHIKIITDPLNNDHKN